MIKYRITAFLTACSMAAALCSCSMSSENSSSADGRSASSSEESSHSETAEDSSEETSGFELPDDIPEEYLDVAEVKNSENLKELRSHISALFDHLDESGNDKAIEEDIGLLLDDFDMLYEISAKKMVAHYLDWNNSQLEDEYDDSDEDVQIAASLLDFAFGIGWHSDEYGDLFEDLYSGDDEDEFDENIDDPDTALALHEIRSRVDFAENDSLLDEYHSLRFNDELSKEEQLRCAEIYLDILSDYDAETFYDEYYRDYTGEEITELSKTIRESMLPVLTKIMLAWMDEYQKVMDMDIPDDSDPLPLIRKYAPQLSDDISNAINGLIDEKLYYIAEGENCYNVSFMEYLPASKKAFIYINPENGALSASVHEFGHYYASTYDTVPSYLSTNNVDIAETQSQGLELLFSRFYDDIYGEAGEEERLNILYELTYAAITGFLIGEFEYNVVKNKDTYTPEDVLKCWEDIVGSHQPLKLYEINHVFECPGYYIGYGVSALAAFQIWEDGLYDPDEAVRKYENIAKISCNDKDYQFRSALEKAGFNDVLDKDYIKNLAEEIKDYIKDIK